MNKKQEEKIIEYATLHSKDCCVHTGDCDFDVKRMECCENMRIISTLLKQERQDIIEIIEKMRFYNQDYELEVWIKKIKKDIIKAITNK